MEFNATKELIEGVSSSNDTAMEQGPIPTKRRRRTFSKEQLAVLQNEFQKTTYITSSRRLELAQRLGISVNNVKVWFQNKRAEKRRKIETKHNFEQLVSTIIEGVMPEKPDETAAVDDAMEVMANIYKTRSIDLVDDSPYRQKQIQLIQMDLEKFAQAFEHNYYLSPVTPPPTPDYS